MNAAEYRAADGVNFSSLKNILQSPAHYRAGLEEQRKETPAMLLGTLTHAAILEGAMIDDIAAVKPDGLSLATKEGKEWKAANEGMPIISYQEAKDIDGMALSVINNPHAKAILDAFQCRETPVFANLRGVKCKALIDAYGIDPDGEICIADLKTTDDASPFGFAKKVRALHYDMQAAFYSQIMARLHDTDLPPYWIWIAVEKSPPYTCAVYAAERWIDSGNEKVESALESLKECLARDEWPQPWQGINELPFVKF